ncbi:MAG: hypothetical protein ACPF80_06600, partial [Flavobacteriaceae bacterium]
NVSEIEPSLLIDPSVTSDEVIVIVGDVKKEEGLGFEYSTKPKSRLIRGLRHVSEIIVYNKRRTKFFEIGSNFIKSLVQILAKLVNIFIIHCKTFEFNSLIKQKKPSIFRKASHWLSYEPLANQ